MKKFLIIGSIVGLVILVLGLAGYTYARAQAPAAVFGQQMMRQYQTDGVGPGMMGGRGYGMMGERGNGMMGGRGGQNGPLHDDMIAALADGLGLTPEELQAQIDAGVTPYEVAQDQGLTDEQIQALFEQAHDEALAAAVEAGDITQEQADRMEQMHDQMWENGFGPGSGGCHGGDRDGRSAPRP